MPWVGCWAQGLSLLSAGPLVLGLLGLSAYAPHPTHMREEQDNHDQDNEEGQVQGHDDRNKEGHEDDKQERSRVSHYVLIGVVSFRDSGDNRSPFRSMSILTTMNVKTALEAMIMGRSGPISAYT